VTVNGSVLTLASESFGWLIKTAADTWQFVTLGSAGGGGGGSDWPESIAGATYDGVSFSVAAQDTFPQSVAFNDTGSKMYVIGYSSDAVYQYTLSTPWDLSTAAYDSVSFSVAAQDGNSRGVAFNDTGSKMYVIGYATDTVYQYTLSTPWDLSTAAYGSVSLNVTARDTNPQGVAFNDTGSKMYVIGYATDAVYQYTLSTPWDLSTAAYDSVSFSVAAQDGNSHGVAFNDTGSKMYVVGDSNNAVYQYTLSTPWDLSTAAYGSVSLNVTAQDTAPRGVAFNDTGSKMYVIGYATDAVYQYTTEP
jgi:hypothetical protein